MTETTSRLVRLARLHDADELGDMSRRLVESGLNWRWRPNRIRHAIRHPESTVIVAEIKDRVSGFALINFGDTSAHLSLLAVNPHYQRQGIAGTLLDWLVKSCRVAGIGRINLEVRSNNSSAIALYGKYGFERTGFQRNYYDGREDALRLSLPLIGPDDERNRPR